VHHAYATVFPRRQKSFTLRAKFMNHPEVDFKIANRFQSTSVQELVSEPLPAARTVGSTNYVLSRLKVHSYNGGHSFEPRLKIAVDGEDRTDWFRPQFNYVDATGNRAYSLCAFEPALKIEADIYHSYKAPFDEDQIARMSNLEIPESGEFTPLAQRMDIGDVSLRFIALCGPGRFTFSNDVCVASSPAEQSTGGSFSSSSSSGPPRRVELSFQRKHPTLIVEIDGLNRSEELLVRGRNETNKLFRVDFNGSADRTYLYEVTTPTNSVRFDLEFIPQKALRLEYTVALPRREE
jgi:hypothetical protein